MSFDGNSYVRHIAQRLIQEFEFSGKAGTPGLVGASKEHPARKQLQSLMPYGIGVGSGIIVDSYGAVSKQQDIIIFEKLCPVFSHNDTPEATFYPVEGVIAAGEVKSTLHKAELVDAFQKSLSVKRLRRHAIAVDEGLGYPTVSYRNYGARIATAATKDDEFDQRKSLHQIYTFILCHKFGSSGPVTLKNAAEQCRLVGPENAPNFISSLTDGFIVPHNSKTNSITRAVMEADGILFCDKGGEAFVKLLWFLRMYAEAGKTVEASHFRRYFTSSDQSASDITINAREPV